MREERHGAETALPRKLPIICRTADELILITHVCIPEANSRPRCVTCVASKNFAAVRASTQQHPESVSFGFLPSGENPRPRLAELGPPGQMIDSTSAGMSAQPVTIIA